MKKKFFLSAAVFLAALVFAGCDQEPFERRAPLPAPPYDIKTGYDPFKGPLIPKSAIWIKSAEVTADPGVIKVTFNDDVTIADPSMFKVKANDKPAVRIGWFSGSSLPMLDKGAEIRDVTKAQSTNGDKYDTVWLLTMSAPARHGEIIRLAANDQSAYTDGSAGIPAPLANPAGQWPLSQFIVRNLVKRTGISPSAPGFYENGLDKTDQLEAGADEDLYQRAITWLASDANRTVGATYTIVLGADQNYNAADTFTAAQVPGAAAAVADEVVPATDGFTIVLAADGAQRVITVMGTGPGTGPRGTHDGTTSDGSALVLRNGVTLIIEENVVIEHENRGQAGGTLSKYPLIAIRDGGKLVLDGGEIRGNYVIAGSRGTSTQQLNAGGVFAAPTDDTGAECTIGGQAFFIMNSGKVTGNTVQQNERGTSAGGIVLHRKSCFVMHGGEVSGNKFVLNSTATGILQFYAGGIAGFGSPTDNDSSNAGTNLGGIYITGGKIENNGISTINNSTSAVRISVGGVFLAGSFQKTGGTISGNTNNMDSTVSSVGLYRQVVVNHSAGANKTVANIFYRNEDAGEDVLLFSEGIRTVMASASSANSAGRVFGAGFKPPFMPSFGTAATGFFPNGWEN